MITNLGSGIKSKTKAKLDCRIISKVSVMTTIAKGLNSSIKEQRLCD